VPTEPSWLVVLLFLASGFVLLAKGADWLVSGSSSIARRFGVSTLAIGLTVVAWGTSAPEVVTSAMAALEGQSALSLGNVLGSNIANIGLVLGSCAIVLPAVMQARLGRRDLVWLFASLAALWIVAADHSISRVDAAILLGLFLIYNAILFFTSRTSEAVDESASGPFGRAAAVTAAGMVGVALGAWLVVQGATQGANMLGVDQRVIGLTVVALGTSLPELAAGLGGAFKGEADISIGNVVGSNVFNVLAVLGIVGLVRPLEADAMPTPEARAELEAAFEGSLGVDLPMVLAFSVAAVLLPYIGGREAGRLKGLILLGAYAAYTARLFGV
jgi:cation:H+ antiporter